MNKAFLKKKTLEKNVEDAIDITSLLGFLLSLASWGCAFFYFVYFGDAFGVLGLAGLGVIAQIFTGDLAEIFMRK